MRWHAPLVACLCAVRPASPYMTPGQVLSQGSPAPSARGRCDLQQGSLHAKAILLASQGRLHVAVLDPLSLGPRWVLRTDGYGAAFTDRLAHRHWVAIDADEALNAWQTRAGPLDLTILGGLLLGQLPPNFTSARRLPDGRTAAVWEGDPSLVAFQQPSAPHPSGAVLGSSMGEFSVAWGRWHHQLPRHIELSVASRRLTLDCSWEPIEHLPASAFSLRAPPGYSLEPLEWTGRHLAEASVRYAATAEEP